MGLQIGCLICFDTRCVFENFSCTNWTMMNSDCFCLCNKEIKWFVGITGVTPRLWTRLLWIHLFRLLKMLHHLDSFQWYFDSTGSFKHVASFELSVMFEHLLQLVNSPAEPSVAEGLSVEGVKTVWGPSPSVRSAPPCGRTPVMHLACLNKTNRKSVMVCSLWCFLLQNMLLHRPSVPTSSSVSHITSAGSQSACFLHILLPVPVQYHKTI